MHLRVLEGCLAWRTCSVNVSFYCKGLVKGRWLGGLQMNIQ